MQAIGAEELLQVWERGRAQPGAGRALALLALALPGYADADLATISLGRRDRALALLRRQLFGRALSARLDCPACGERLGILLQLPDTSAADVEVGEFVSNDGLRFRVPDSTDLAALADATDADAAVQMLLHRCCVDAPEMQPERWSTECVAEIEAGFERLDGDGELCLDLRCDRCGHSWQTAFDPAPFLWEEIDASARHLLRDVHRLARAYGWSEREILALSASRRAAYLEMLA